MSLSTTIDAMVLAGCSAEQVAAVVRAHEAEGLKAIEARRAKDAERKRKSRATEKSHGHAVTPADATDETSPEVSPQRDINQTPHPTPSVPSLRSGEIAREDEIFAEFRAAYPRRRADNWQQARKSFAKALRQGVDPQAVISGARSYAASRDGEDPQFTQMAATWLNQRGWEVDYAPLKSARAPPRAGSGGGFASLLADSMREKHERAQQPERLDLQDVPLLSVRDETGRGNGGDDDGGLSGNRARLLVANSVRRM